MTINRWQRTAVACMILTMAACRQQAAPTAIPPTPTLNSQAAATATIAPSATPIVRDTLPPTWTPAISYTPTATLTPSITLTPSKTPTNTWTPTVTKTPTPNTTDFALLSRPLVPQCADFGADASKNTNQFKLGSDATVAWTPVSSAAVYVVRLFDIDQATVLTDKTTNTSYTFKADKLTSYLPYAWTVAPLDNDGVQICPSRGSSLVGAP